MLLFSSTIVAITPSPSCGGGGGGNTVVAESERKSVSHGLLHADAFVQVLTEWILLNRHPSSRSGAPQRLFLILVLWANQLNPVVRPW